MCDEHLKKLFDKLRAVQKEIDARLDSPEVLSISTIETLFKKEQVIIHAIVMAANLPKALSDLKVASAAAQEAHVAHEKGQLSLEERNKAIRVAHDKRDDLIHVMNRGLQLSLEDYNSMVRSRPELVAEFGIHEASTLCAAS